MDKGAWQATVHGLSRVKHDLATNPIELDNSENEVECVRLLLETT